MSKDYLEINLYSVNDNVKFEAAARQNQSISVDYFPPIGSGEGYTSLELLMISFTSCISSTLLTVLRAFKHKNVISLKAGTRGFVREEHPKALTEMQLELIFLTPDAEQEDIESALALAENKLCPVWAMLKGNVKITVSYSIEKQ